MNKLIKLILPLGVLITTILLTIVLCINMKLEDTKFREDYPQLEESKLIIKYTTADEVLELLENNYELEVIMQDERLSTVTAESFLIKNDISRKKRKQVIDKMASQVILQSFLDKYNNEQKRGEL